MKKTFRRALACLLTVLMVVCSFPFSALAVTNSREWWVADGIEDPTTITEEPTYWGYNSPEDPEHQPYGPWYLGFGSQMQFGRYDLDENGYDDHREDFKPIISATISYIGQAGMDPATELKSLATGYYGASTAMDYDTVMAAGNILNPAQLKAGQRIAVTFEFGGFDVLNCGQIKAHFNNDYLVPAAYPTAPGRKDTWKQITGSSASAWMKTGADMGYGSGLAFAGQNSDTDTDACAIFTNGGGFQAGIQDSSNFIGTGLNDPDGARPFGKYGIVIGVIGFEVLQDCDFTDVFSYDNDDAGTIFEPYYRGVTAEWDGMDYTDNDVVNSGQYLITGAPDDNSFAIFTPVWANYSKDTAPAHEHSFDGAVAVSNGDGTHTMTCTADGCDQSEGYQQTANCAYSSETTPATCTEDGKIVYTCTACNYSYETVINATGHDYGDWTAVDADTHKKVCKNDAAHVETANHNFGDLVVTEDPTYDTPGKGTKTCADCGYVLEVEIPANTCDHANTSTINAKAATCTEDGYTGDTFCNDCKKTIATGEVIKAEGHKAVSADNAVAATCTEDGKEADTVCSVCDALIAEGAVIPATGHTPVSADNAVAATCEADGKEADTVCSVCDALIAEGAVIPATGHTPVSADNAVDPTFDAPGKEADTVCSVCDKLLEEGAVIPALKGYTVAVTATDLGTTTLDGEDATDGASKKVLANSDVTLTATPVEGATFIGWSVDGKIVSNEAEMTATVVSNVEYTPVFTVTTADEFTVVFIDQYGNVIDTQTVASGADIVEPAAPVRIGYTFAGWSLSADEIDALTEGATITAKYTKDAATTYTVTAEGCTITVNGTEYTDVASGITYNTKVTVTKAGTDYWTIEGAEVAYGETYSFYVGSDVTVVANVDEAVVAKPTVAAVSVSQVGDLNRHTYLATRSVPAGYTVVSAGYLYGKDIDVNDMTLDNIGTNGIRVAYANTAAEQFSLTVGSKSAGTVYAKAFIVCKDASGVVAPVYAEVQSHTYA